MFLSSTISAIAWTYALPFTPATRLILSYCWITKLSGWVASLDFHSSTEISHSLLTVHSFVDDAFMMYCML